MSSHQSTKKDAAKVAFNYPDALLRFAETLAAGVVIVIRAKPPAPPAWHLQCPHCHAFALVRIGRLARAPPACIR